jgi:hypothetical protein
MKTRLLFFCVFINLGTIQAQIDLSINYVPSDSEIQYYMNLYERLKSIDRGEQEFQQLGDIYKRFENKASRYYSTYQRLLFESYLLMTANKEVQEYIISYIKSNKLEDEFSDTLERKYKSTRETYKMDEKDYFRFNYEDTYVDENINMFNMNEVTLFDNQIGLMLFENDWNIFHIDDPKKTDRNFVFLLFGGGTNTIKISIDRMKKIAFSNFRDNIIYGNTFKNMFSNFQLSELKTTGVLARAGADRIYLGIGQEKDKIFDIIENFSAVLYFYSEKEKTGYVIDYFMNISPKNNNFEIRDRLFNHLLFQAYLSFMNINNI